MKRFFLALSLGLALAAAGAWAKTPDGKPPSVETVCDQETGAAFGLCNAYCEAMDCDSDGHRASDAACEKVKGNFERKTGRPLPCEFRCPCGELIPLFAALVSGAADVGRCVADTEIISVLTPGGSFVLVNTLTAPPFCAANLEPPFVELTAAEALVCRDALRRAAAGQNVVCEFPE